MRKIAVVTGASSGIGLSTARELSRRGCRVYCLSRRRCPDSEILHIKTDITDEASVNDAITEIFEKEGQIDILINNAGGGISGAVEFTPTEEAKNLFDLNFFGAVRVSNAVIPIMRKQGRGKIINVSSVAAVTPIPFQTYYSASKSAIMTYSMALANELSNFGIIVSTVLPGDIKTEFTATRNKNEFGDDVYNGRISRSVSKMEKDEQSGMSPDKAGSFIASVALNNRNKPVYTIGFGYKCITALASLLPKSVINYLIKILYAK